MGKLKMKIMHGLYYEISNTLRSKNFWCYVSVSILLSISGYLRGGAFDAAFGLLAGLRQFTLDDISMNEIIRWLMPHLLLSTYIGEYSERDFHMQRLSILRYKSLRSYWRFQTFKLMITSFMYYILILLGSSLISYAFGNRMLKVSDAALSRYDLYSGNMPNSWIIMFEILLRTGLVMTMVGLIQIAVAWLTNEQRYGVVAFVLLMLASLFMMNTSIQQVLPCNISMYIRGDVASNGLNLIWVCVICVGTTFATLELLRLFGRLRTMVVS